MKGKALNALAHKRVMAILLAVSIGGGQAREPARESIFYSTQLAAQTGRNGLVGIEAFPSINQGGAIAFVGHYTGAGGAVGDNIYTWDNPNISGNGVLRPLSNPGLFLPSESDGPSQKFGAEIQLNDQGQVLAWRYMRARVLVGGLLGTIQIAPFTYMETWDAFAERSIKADQVAMGNTGEPAPYLTILNPLWAGSSTWDNPEYGWLINSPSAFDLNSPFEIVRQPCSINNQGKVVFNGRSVGIDYFVTIQNTGFYPAPVSGGGTLYAQVADNDMLVYRATSGNIKTLSYRLDSPQTLADVSRFTNTGLKPGISDDGKVVVFVADEGDPSKRGIFVCTEAGGRRWTEPLRIAGLRHNGVLDPGEGYTDLNFSQKFEAANGETDEGPFTGFDLNTSVNVQRMRDSSTGIYRVIFLADRIRADDATSTPSRTICAMELDLSKPDEVVRAVGYVCAVGEVLRFTSGEVVDGGAVLELGLHDSLNTLGDVAFWAKTGSKQVMVRARATKQSLELIDFNNPVFRGKGEGLATILATEGEAVRGFSADGVTSIMIRTPAFTTPGSVFFRVETEDGESGEIEDVGTLEDVSSQVEHANPLDVSLRMVSPGEYRAFAVWKAPIDFVRSGTAYEAADRARGNHNPRRLKVKLTYFPDGIGDIRKLETICELHRPPVVLLHGLHDRSSSWNWSIQHDSRFRVFTPNYRMHNGDSFVANMPRVRDFIAQAVKSMRSSGIACTQVDAFGHSMGGLLLRLFSTDSQIPNLDTEYKREDNFGQGDLHKLVTVNTPHWGSQVAPALVDKEGNLKFNLQVPVLHDITGSYLSWMVGSGFCGDAPDAYRCVECGAVRDLRPDSDILRDLNRVFVSLPVHAIYGIGGDSSETTSGYGLCKRRFYFLGQLFTCGLPSLSSLVDGWFWEDVPQLKPSVVLMDDNDTVVGAGSQRGGLGGDFVTEVQGGEALHFPVINEYPSGVAASRAVELLQCQVHSRHFAEGFPTRDVQPLIQFEEDCEAAQAPVRMNLDLGRANLSPPSAAGANDQLWVRLSASDQSQANRWILFDSLGNAYPSSGSGTITIQLPGRRTEPLWLIAVAQLDDNRIGASNPVSVEANTAEVPDGLRFTDDHVEMLTTDLPLRVGLETKGRTTPWHAVFPSQLGITFETSQPSVAGLSPDGRVIAISGGLSKITARLGALEASTHVTVEEAIPIYGDLSFAQWSMQLPPGRRNASDRPFGDGLPNAVRYAFGINPVTNADTRNLPKITTERINDRLVSTIEFQLGRGVNPQIISLERSQDLKTWSSVPTDNSPQGTRLESSGKRFRLTVQSDRQSAFYRINLRD